jgi:hypothetical protein
MLGFNLHAGFQRFDTGPNVGYAVDDHDTVSAASDRTEHTPGFISPGGIAMNHYAVASQSDGDGFVFKTLHGLPIKGKLDFFALFKGSQNRVLFYAHDDMSCLKKSGVLSPQKPVY